MKQANEVQKVFSHLSVQELLSKLEELGDQVSMAYRPTVIYPRFYTINIFQLAPALTDITSKSVPPGAPRIIRLTGNTSGMLRHYAGNRKKGYIFINGRTGERLM